ncbi:MAG: hypothetical protein QOI24_1669 [Acidobacteriota bacterium]|jgi:hypothetical protein|nr:hypothetical protein [Acidobacteriota bacterium]
MEAYPVRKETVIPAGRTLQDVLSAGGGELNQDTFELAANDAEHKAVATKGDAYAKSNVFGNALMANCRAILGEGPNSNPIPRSLTLVVDPCATPPFKCFLMMYGALLTYQRKGDDKYWYEAAVYP